MKLPSGSHCSGWRVPVVVLRSFSERALCSRNRRESPSRLSSTDRWINRSVPRGATVLSPRTPTHDPTLGWRRSRSMSSYIVGRQPETTPMLLRLATADAPVVDVSGAARRGWEVEGSRRTGSDRVPIVIAQRPDGRAQPGRTGADTGTVDTGSEARRR